MNLRRFLLTAASVAPAAQAATTSVSFDVAQDASATVELESALTHTRFEVTRNGAIRGSSTGTELALGSLAAGDQVTVYDGATAVATIAYDGLPAITDTACAGRSIYGAKRAATASIVDAGAYDSSGIAVESFWTTEENAVISLKRPLAAGDVTYVRTVTSDGETTVSSARRRWARRCEDSQDLTQNPPPPPPPPTQTIAPPELTPSSAQLTRAVKGSLSATGSSLRARTTRRLARSNTVALPFAFPEAGRVELLVVANKRVIGSGAKASAVNGKVILAVQLTPAGRRLLKRSKKLKVTVRGTFTPSRVGAEPQRASVNVTLTGSSSRA